MLKAIPAIWDETVVLPGSEPAGTMAGFARRRGKDWFVGVINGASARSLTVDLGFLRGGDWTLVSLADDPAKPDAFARSERSVRSTDAIEAPLRTASSWAGCVRNADHDGYRRERRDGRQQTQRDDRRGLAAAALSAASAKAVTTMPTPSGAGRAQGAGAGPVPPDWQSLTSGYSVPDWFRDAKFGMWAHWTARCRCRRWATGMPAACTSRAAARTSIT
ncbi:glycoside hydrolase family 97 C-terminal domain-containing protein [Sphingomonas sp. MMS24-JH45]